jgi:ketosteroid isomerase-like protein
MVTALSNQQAGTPATIVSTFNAAFNAHDVNRVMSMMTDDVIFENTFPAPDGERYEGQAAVRAFWDRLFHNTPTAHFEEEDSFTSDDRATVCWRYTWTDPNGHQGHIRGVDVIRIRNGKISEKRSYVKG